MRLLCAIALLLLALPLHAAEKTSEAPPLKPAYRERVIEAINAFHAEDFETALKKVDEAETIQPGTTAIANLRGAIALESGRFAEAEKHFKAALAIDPDFFPAKFNLGEIPFKQKNYGESRQIYNKLLEEHPEDELVQYKVFLSYLLENKPEMAQKVLDNMKFPSDTPAYYYAHAAWDYKRRNAKEAEAWVQSSARIFPAHKNLIYAETLEELGWLRRSARAKPAAAPEP